MTLSAGTHLGPYQIVEPLGMGGMGEVYLANDSKLARKVAIKVLPELMTRDKERVARFASLICTNSTLTWPLIQNPGQRCTRRRSAIAKRV